MRVAEQVCADDEVVVAAAVSIGDGIEGAARATR